MNNLIKNDNLKDYVCLQLSNSAKVSNRIDDIPMRQYLDLYVTYNFYTNNFGSIKPHIITNDDMKTLNMTEEELYDIALENTKRIFPPKMRKLDDIISELTGMDMNCESPLYYIGNESGQFGSAVLLYDDLPEKIYEILQDDFYYIPASIHEYLLVTEEDTYYCQSNLIDMVRCVNREVLTDNMVLSDNIYHYCHKSKEISVLIK